MSFLIILTLFILVPFTEIALFIKLGGSLGTFNTLLLVIATAVLGAWLVRQQGFQTLANIRNQMDAGHLPAMEMAEGVALLFAGALLLTPGFLTDTIGFCLLAPPIRRTWIKFLGRRGLVSATTAGQRTGTHSQPQNKDDIRTIIEGEYYKEDD
ncbi:MAG: FxsA family protein [Proteobacteria bacterium]|jgi:UPF0716 protein FxsA|nr:FxsA family protein [Pseudomonadota bacterium]